MIIQSYKYQLALLDYRTESEKYNALVGPLCLSLRAGDDKPWIHVLGSPEGDWGTHMRSAAGEALHDLAEARSPFLFRLHRVGAAIVRMP